MKKHLSKFVLLFVALGVGIALYQMPTAPADKAKLNDIDAKIAQGTALVSNGDNPMEGIKILREVLAEDPENIKVHYQLGLFSLQSGQLDKAVDRFVKVNSKKDPEYVNAFFFLGQAYAGLGKNQQAIQAFTTFKQTSSDTAAVNGVDKLINELTK